MKQQLKKSILSIILVLLLVISGIPDMGVIPREVKAALGSDVTKTLDLGLSGSKGKTMTYNVASIISGTTDTTTYTVDSVTGNPGATLVTQELDKGVLSVVVASGSAGATATIKVKVVDGENNATFTLNVTLHEKTPLAGSVTAGSTTYGNTLENVSLYNGYKDPATGESVSGTLAWVDKTTEVTVENDGYAYNFTPTDSEYETISGKIIAVSVSPMKINVATPTLPNMVYDATKTLATLKPKTTPATAVVNGKTVTVAGTWEFKDSNKAPEVGNDGYSCTFTPTDSNFETKTVKVSVVVTKATPKFTTKPTISAINMGQTLSDAKFTGYVLTCQGEIQWENGSIKPTVADSGKTKYNYYFKPADTKNYEILTDSTTIVVNKKNDAPNTPKDLYVGKGEKTVSDVGLPANWQWSSKDAKKTIGENTGDTITATAEYVGDDKANYQNITKVVLITRDAKCYHSTIQYRNAKKATCEEAGYQGDKYCKVCGKFVGNGELTSPLGHNYTSSITTRPTVSTAGVRTYRCTRCSHSYTESILSTSDNAAGNIYLRPALYENVKTASVTLSGADIDTAIESASGKTITVNVSPMSGGTGMKADKVDITLTKEVQSKLISSGITSTVLHTPQAEISFSLSALTDIQSQAGGDATVTMQDVTGEEKRPRYNFTVYKNDGETAITDFTTTGITVKIPYTRQSVNSDGEVVTGGTLEDTSGILGIYVDSSGNAEYVTGSYFDSTTGNVVIPTNHLSIYGVGYKVGSSNTVSSSKVVRARADASKKYVKIKITKVSGATKYVIYGAQTGKTTKKLKTITGTSAKITGLKAKTFYKYYVKAYKGSTLLGKSKICYVYTTGGKYGNQKSVTVTPTTLSLAAGGSESLKVTYKKSGKLKKFTSYVRYATSNSAVATVSSSGEVKGLTAGSCYIYIYTMNGYQKSVKVTVS